MVHKKMITIEMLLRHFGGHDEYKLLTWNIIKEKQIKCD